VPPSGFTATLTLLAAAAMAFLAVFALALALAAGRMADRWEEGLAGTASLRLPPGEAGAALLPQALRILGQTPGVGEARALSDEENARSSSPGWGPTCRSRRCRCRG
jgi:cell division transport system permease protein